VRQIVDAGVQAGHLDLLAENAELNTTLASALMAPTRIYVKPLLNVMRDFTLHGLVHVTGGGFVGNVPRILPKGVRARIDAGSWPRPAIFGLLQRHGELTDDEMLRVFNCGLGMLVIVPREQANDIRERLDALGERTYRIGEIEAKASDESALLIAPPRPRTS
jgi:phosphoribosylformylglycinamidine cyclo-ligase